MACDEAIHASLLALMAACAFSAAGDAVAVSDFSPVTDAAAVASGSNFNCMITYHGGVECWGLNLGGQTGQAGELSTMTPKPVPGLPSAAVAITAGTEHACALDGDGAVYCWGKGNQGQLGDGKTLSTPTAVRVEGLLARSVSAGKLHTCAIDLSGGVFCWGDNAFGALGNGGVEDSAVPVQVQGMTNVVGVAAGAEHTCAVQLQGTVWCWGEGQRGQLGNGEMVSSAVPVLVAGVGDAKAIVVGAGHACALRASGEVACWGVGEDGAIGNGATGDQPVPQPVEGLSGVRALSASGRHVCALSEDAVPRCWGWNWYGQLGGGIGDVVATPALAHWATEALSVHAGSSHTCIRRTGGEVHCWGNNGDGQIGYGGALRRRDAVSPIGLSANVVQMESSDTFSCALMQHGTVRCWGDFGSGGVPLPPGASYRDLAKPTRIAGLDGAVSLGVGYDHLCAVLLDGSIRCRGSNAYGVLGNGSAWGIHATPVVVVGLDEPAISISTRAYKSCALMRSGKVKCWGDGRNGDGVSFGSYVPVDVVNLGEGGALAVGTGSGFACVLTASGGVKCWGSNAYGRLGDGSGGAQATPVQVSGLAERVVALSVNVGHACALRDDGELYCWGSNGSGQLGDGTRESRVTPVRVGGLPSDIVSVRAGVQETCAVDSKGGAMCWGNNIGAQLGNGSQAQSNVPVPVTVVDEPIAHVETSLWSACALIASGGVRCWGENRTGNLGIGTRDGIIVSMPSQVQRFIGPMRVFSDTFDLF